jgi:hypothetical protein
MRLLSNSWHSCSLKVQRLPQQAALVALRERVVRVQMMRKWRIREVVQEEALQLLLAQKEAQMPRIARNRQVILLPQVQKLLLEVKVPKNLRKREATKNLFRKRRAMAVPLAQIYRCQKSKHKL